MNRDNLHDLRTDYKNEIIEKKDLAKNPMDQFQLWFQDALDNNVKEVNAFSLATSTKDGKVSNRIVLVKEILGEGIVFYTNYNSRKGQQLQENPHASACFFWQPLSKQIRIEGLCEKIDTTKSDAYYYKRPLGSRIGAATSPQSDKIESRQWLENQWNKNLEELGEEVQRPEFWGGYILKPTRIEFWQGQPSRLHDRFLYELIDGEWVIDRLAP